MARSPPRLQKGKSMSAMDVPPSQEGSPVRSAAEGGPPVRPTLQRQLSAPSDLDNLSERVVSQICSTDLDDIHMQLRALASGRS